MRWSAVHGFYLHTARCFKTPATVGVVKKPSATGATIALLLAIAAIIAVTSVE
jgi:hypothetical protein